MITPQERAVLRQQIRDACYDFGRFSRRRTVRLEEIGAYADQLALRVLDQVCGPEEAHPD